MRGAILQDYGNIQNPPSDNSYQLQAMQNMQRDKEFNMQFGQRKKEKSDKEAIDLIGDIKLDHIGDNTIDVTTDKLLQGLQSQLMGMHLNGASTTDLMIYAQKELPKISNGHTLAKDEYNKVVEAQKNILKDYPEGNAESARNLMGKELLNNVLEFNKDGSVKGYKDISLVNPSKNYSDILFDKEKMNEWYPNSVDAVVGNIQKTRGLTPIKGQIKSINKKGGYTDKKYEGHISIYDVPILNDEGKITGIRLDSESIPLGKNEDGTPNFIQVMPKDKYEVFRGDGKSAMQFDKAVYDHISKDLGINPNALDPQAIDIYSRNYALNMLEKTKLHGSSYNQFDVEKQDPIRYTTNINTGSSVPVMDIVTPVRKYLEANKDRTVTYDSNDGTRKELSGIAQLNTFTNEVTDPIVDKVKSRYPNTNAGQIYYRNIDGETWVVKAEEEGKINPEKDTIVFKLDDFSNVSGNKAQGQKSKNEALRRAQSGTKTDENTNQDLDPNGFKKEGKYWRYKDGRLFDDKGNVIKK